MTYVPMAENRGVLVFVPHSGGQTATFDLYSEIYKDRIVAPPYDEKIRRMGCCTTNLDRKAAATLYEALGRWLGATAERVS